MVESDLQIGKDGYEKALDEIKMRLEKYRTLRIKVNKPLIEGRMKEYTRKIADKVAAATESTVEMVKGRTFIIKKIKK